MAKKKKVLLVQPRRDKKAEMISITFGEMPSQALRVLATLIQKTFGKDVDVRILDLRFEKPNALAKALIAFKPDLVGVTGITIDQPFVLEVARTTKVILPRVKVVVGGHHATMLPEDYFVPEIDLIVQGPGQLFPQIIEELTEKMNFHKIPGTIVWKNEDDIVRGSDWKENIPGTPIHIIPDYSLTKQYKWKTWFMGHHVEVVNTSCGCGGRCSFCVLWREMNGQRLAKTPEEAVRAILLAPSNQIFLGDPNSFEDVGWSYEFARLLIDGKSKKILEGYCDAVTIAKNPYLFELLYRAGFRRLTVGLEAIDEARLKGFNKRTTLESNKEAIEILRKCKIECFGHILISPLYSKEEIRAIGKYSCEVLGLRRPIYTAETIFPGTPDWKKYWEILMQVDRRLFDLAHLIPGMSCELSSQDFLDELIRLYKKNYSFFRWLVNDKKRVPPLWTIPLMKLWLREQDRRGKRFCRSIR